MTPATALTSVARGGHPPATQQSSSHGRGLVVDHVTVSTGEHRLLDRVNLEMQSGCFGVLLGPNGAGKSTLLSSVAGLRRATSGHIWLDGERLDAIPPSSLATRRALLPQDTALAFDFTVRDVVELGRYPHRNRPSTHENVIVQSAMQLTGVQALAQRRYQQLSGGERLRTHLARTFAQIWEPCPEGKPRWLFLDEPTAALDLHHQHNLLTTVRQWATEQGVGVLAVLHDINLALRYADRIWVLTEGRVVAHGSPQHIMDRHLVRAVWGVDATVFTDDTGVRQITIRGCVNG